MLRTQLFWGSHWLLAPFSMPRTKITEMLFLQSGENDLIFQIGRLRQKEELDKSSKIQNKCTLESQSEILVSYTLLFSAFPQILPQLNTEPDQN